MSAEEVERRLTQYGYNELTEEKVNPLLKFLSYLWGPIPWMIEIAAILSAVVRHWADFWIILAILVANAIVGFWEEYQAGNAIAALKNKLALRAKVKRNGAWSTIAARELVPGDVIRLRIGDIVPADAKLMAGDPIEVDQSALTGESLPVVRKPDEPCTPVPSSGKAKSMGWSTPRDRKHTSVRLRSWPRRPIPSAISRRRC